MDEQRHHGYLCPCGRPDNFQRRGRCSLVSGKAYSSQIMIAAVQRLYSCDYVTEVTKKPVRQVIFPAGIGFLFSFFVIFIVHLFIHFCFPHAADPYVSAFMYPFSFSYSLCPVLYFLHLGYQQYAILSFRTSFDFLMQKRLPQDSLHIMNFFRAFSACGSPCVQTTPFSQISARGSSPAV